MPRRRRSPAQRREVVRRASGCCEYCRCPERFCPDSFSVEHVVPLEKEGADEPANLALSCQGCNNHKFTSVEALDPITGEVVALFHPRLMVWRDHFAWDDTYTLVIGLTATGRATIDRLKLNRPPVVNLRRVLHSEGHHPPEESPR